MGSRGLKAPRHTQDAAELALAIASTYDGSAIPATEKGAVGGVAKFNRTASVFNVVGYGATGDGTTDDAAAVQAAIDAAYAAGGGTVYFPEGTYRVNAQLTIPDTEAATNPTMPGIRLHGAGAFFSGRNPIQPSGGSILDLRYAGAGAAILTLGLGLLDINGLTLADLGAANATPFILTTYTTLHIHGCSFYTPITGLSCTKDAIICGGTLASEGPRGDNVGFQGYGTVIRDNYFGGIRRALYGRVFFNANVFQNNTIWRSCGSNLADGAAIEVDGDPDDVTSQRAVGNVITGNLIEMTYYPYGVKLREANNNTLLNNFYDETSTTLALYRMEAQAEFNVITAGFHSDSYTFVSEEATVEGDNTIINAHQLQETVWSQPWTFSHTNGMKIYRAGTAAYGPFITNQDGHSMNHRLESQGRTRLYHTPDGGTTVLMTEVRDLSNVMDLSFFNASSYARVRNTTGPLRLNSLAGTEVQVGDPDAPLVTLKGYLQFPAIAAADAANNSVFVDTADGALKFRNGSGVVSVITGA